MVKRYGISRALKDEGSVHTEHRRGSIRAWIYLLFALNVVGWPDPLWRLLLIVFPGAEQVRRREAVVLIYAATLFAADVAVGVYVWLTRQPARRRLAEAEHVGYSV